MAFARLSGMGDVTDVEPKPQALPATPNPMVADSDPWCTYAHIEVADLRIAIAAEHVRQAVPRPAQVARLPGSHGALEGVFKLRGQVVPIVDLRPWMHLPTDTRQPHVMVLGAQDKVVGVPVDAIHGLLRLRASRVQTVHHDEASSHFFHSVLSVDDDSELISVLDPLRLMNQARAWANGTASISRFTHTTERETGSHTPTQALVQLGPALLGVPAAAVREVLPLPALQRIFGRGTPMLGMARWRGIDVPVIDPANALALPPDADLHSQRLLMVLENQGHYLAMPVDGVTAVRRFSTAQVQTAAETALAADRFYVGTTTLDGGQRVLLLDSERVLGDYGLVPLENKVSENSTVQLDTPQWGTAQARASQPHIVFNMGDEWAAPMSALHEITPFPAHLKSGAGNDPAIIGTVEWRGRVLPVLDVRPTAGAVPQASTKLLMVQANERMAALVVNEVVALLPAHQGLHTHVTLAGGKHMHLITVGHPPERKSHPVIDFSTLPFFGEA